MKYCITSKFGKSFSLSSTLAFKDDEIEIVLDFLFYHHVCWEMMNLYFF